MATAAGAAVAEARTFSRPLKNYLRWQYCVKNSLGCEPRLGAPIKMLIYST